MGLEEAGLVEEGVDGGEGCGVVEEGAGEGYAGVGGDGLVAGGGCVSIPPRESSVREGLLVSIEDFQVMVGVKASLPRFDLVKRAEARRCRE